MTDQEIVQRLIGRDERVTRWFFHEKCRPLLLSIMRHVFSYPVEYDEMANEVYLLLMEDDARRLRHFDFRSSLFQWLKTVALRHFINKRSLMIEDATQEYPYNETKTQDGDSAGTARVDITRLLGQLKIRRQAYVLQRLVIEDAEPKAVAAELGVTVDNLYNIKKRAITALTQLVLAERKI